MTYRIFFFALLIFAVLINSGKNLYGQTISFEGRWMEIKRVDKNSLEVVSFTDTLQMCLSEEEFRIAEGGRDRNFRKGKIVWDEAGNLTLGDFFFRKQASEETVLVLEDEIFLRTLLPVIELPAERDVFNSISLDTYFNPEKPLFKDLAGAWNISREKVIDPKQNKGDLHLHSIRLQPTENQGIYEGSLVYSEEGKKKKESCTLSVDRSLMLITADRKEWPFINYRTSGNNWIFGQPGTIIFQAKKETETHSRMRKRA